MRGPRLAGDSSWVVPALAVAAVAPLWSGEFPPLTDLPQHAAQVAILRHWHDPACHYPAIYQLFWLTPNTLAYALTWALSYLLSIPTALRLLLSVAVVALALATARLTRRVGGDPWWSLLSLPLAYGLPMSFGFLGFVIAAPLVVALLVPALTYSRQPTPRRGLALGLACAALFFAHVLALGFALLVVGGLIVARAPSPRSWPPRLAPLALALPLPLAWGWRTLNGPTAPQGDLLYLGGLDRLWDLPSALTSIPNRTSATLAVALVLASLAATRPRLSRERSRWLPLGITLAIVLLAPYATSGVSYLPPRFAYYLLPTLLFALERHPSVPVSGMRRGQLAVVALLLLAGVELRYLGMAQEGAGLDAVLAGAPAGARLLYLAYESGSRFSPDPPFLHSGMRYAVDRCGIAERSFARGYQPPVRFRPGVVDPLPELVEFAPDRFRWDRHGGAGYDLFLARSAGEPDPHRIDRDAGRVRLLAQQGRWWLFENRARADASAGGVNTEEKRAQ